MKVIDYIKQADKKELLKQIHEFARICLFCNFSAECRMGNNVLLCNVKADLEREVEK